jgi:predicted Zn-dependent peptidase
VELAKGNALQALAARESTPEFLAETALARAVYGDHPYRIVAASKETLEEIRAVSRSVLPSASQTVVIVGDEPKVKEELAPSARPPPRRPEAKAPRYPGVTGSVGLRSKRRLARVRERAGAPRRPAATPLRW